MIKNNQQKDDIIMKDRRKLIIAGLTGGSAALLIPHMVNASSPSRLNKTKSDSDKQSTVPNIGNRNLGSLSVSSIGLGVQNVSRKYDTSVPYRPEVINVIRTAFDNGVTFFDTAEAYGPFEAERILGESIAPFRNNVVITSKFGWNIDQETGAWLPGLNSRPKHIKLVVENILKRLRTDRIDLLYQHRVDPTIPIEDVAGAVKDLMNEGKVLHWGLSEMGTQTLRRAHKELPVTAVQSEYSMLWRGPEESVLSICEELGIGFVPWSPLGVQLLTGWIDEKTRFAEGDFRSRETRFDPENLAHNVALAKLVNQWAERKNAAPAQIALAWLLAQKPWIVPIPGTTNKDHLLQNIGATTIRFSPNELHELTKSISAITIKGKRLPDNVQIHSGVEAPLKL